MKKHLNVITVGHVDHGKTTLTAALTKVAAIMSNYGKVKNFADIDKAPEEKKRGITINSTCISYYIKYVNDDDCVHVGHTDCPGHADFVKNTITGSNKADVAILVVAATDGPMPQTKEHIKILQTIGVKNIICFINKMDMLDEEGLELVELIEGEIEESVNPEKYNINLKFVRGSALKCLNTKNEDIIVEKEKEDKEEEDKGTDDAPVYGPSQIIQLLNFINENEPAKGDKDAPFIMQIDGVFSIKGQGIVATGKIEQGTLKPGLPVEIVGYEKKKETTITSIEMFNKGVESATVGDSVGVRLRGITVDKKLNKKNHDIVKGVYLAEKNILSESDCFDMLFYINSGEEGGRKLPFFSGYKPQFFYGAASVTGEIRFKGDLDGTIDDSTIGNAKLKSNRDKKNVASDNQGMPGTDVTVNVKLESKIVLRKGSNMLIREGSMTIGSGMITRVY